MLRNLWNNLKRWRKIRLGPIALAFKFERAVDVTRNSGHRLKNASRRHQRWLEALPQMSAGGDPETARQPSEVHGLRGELALIVGVGPGFGYALARRLASEGMAVVVASRNANRLDALTDGIEAEGGTAFAYGCDATSEASVTELFALVRAQHGIPNLVVYSIQNFGPGETIDIQLPAFEEGWRHNCLGPFLVAREAACSMLPVRRGTIILVGSTSSLLGRAGHLNLAAGKFGQRALAQVLSRELWPKGIHVAHLVIDADIYEGVERADGGPQSDPNHISEVVVSLHRQQSGAWTSEIDVRPWNERFWEHC
ncbi:MAG TPA: SDR family NAD(P)-dependent oxidoreductase [Terriglobales bacterium]|jgi:NAD(P)-dependent dehydrogenase (short-subunit alcohol dehydrogenase family)